MTSETLVRIMAGAQSVRVGGELRKAWIDFLEPSEGIDDRCLVKILPELSPNEGFLTVTIGQQFLAIFSYFYVAPLLGAEKPC